MKLMRLVRHLVTTRWSTRRYFSAQVRAAIEQAIARVRGAPRRGDPFRGRDGPRHAGAVARHAGRAQRALQLFGQFGVWDTADNNGVLIYVLMADHAVEIIADRGIAARVAEGGVGDRVPADGAPLPRGRFREGSIVGILGVGALARPAFSWQGRERQRAAEPASAAVAHRRQFASAPHRS